MADYRLIRDAEIDFADIYRYSLHSYGESQADKYASSLIEAFEMLAENPLAGKAADSIMADARCLAHELHTIYY